MQNRKNKPNRKIISAINSSFGNSFSFLIAINDKTQLIIKNTIDIDVKSSIKVYDERF